MAWEAGLEQKGAASRVQKQQGEKALGDRDKAKNEYAARTKAACTKDKHAARPRQGTAGGGAAKGASKGKGKRARAMSPSSEADDDDDGSDDEEATLAGRSSISRRSVQEIVVSSDDSSQEQERM